MADYGPGEPETDTPVNPYSLLEAVNRSSDMAHTGWLIFLGVMAYLTIAIAGVTHVDLLLEKSVQLPIFGIEIPQIQFFQFAPVLLVLFHLGIISQLVLLARKTLEFDLAVQQLETGVRRTHPLRLELHNFFFVQGIAGSNRSRIMGAFLHGMSWLTLVVIPVLLLLFIQIKFLPYHSVEVTWSHRIALLVDVAMLILIGVFLIRPEASFFKAVARSVVFYPLGFVTTVGVFVAVTLFSLFVATVPGETLDRIVQRVTRGADVASASAAPGTVSFARADTSFVMGFAVPSFLARTDGSLFGLFHRNLIVQDMDLVSNRDVTPGEPTLSLRNRDLRFAQLDRSDLHQADLTGANLDGASLEGADLRNIRFQCADLTQLILTDDRGAAKCPTARGANFARATLNGALLAGADLTGASFEEGKLIKANLSYSLLAGSRFSSANLRMANLTGGVEAQGADFLLATLEGADLTGAELQFADFSSATMPAVALGHAKMEGAVLRDADMSGAALHHSKLQGATLSGANLEGADLRWARVWMTEPPSEDKLKHADLSELGVGPLTDIEAKALRSSVRQIGRTATRNLVMTQLRSLWDPKQSTSWAQKDERAKWRDLVADRTVPLDDTAYAVSLAAYLGGLACKTRWPDGSVATGIIRRATGQLFRGSRDLIRSTLSDRSCAPAKAVEKPIMKAMEAAGQG